MVKRTSAEAFHNKSTVEVRKGILDHSIGAWLMENALTNPGEILFRFASFEICRWLAANFVGGKSSAGQVIPPPTKQAKGRKGSLSFLLFRTNQ